LLDVTRRVINEAISRGSVVLVGRGAQSMLSQRSDAIHVFCYAPPGALAARAAERHGIPLHDAEKLVHDTNRDRAHYVRKHWDRDWDAHANYHLCVNTDWLGIAGAASTVVHAVRERFPDTTTPGPR
jgi:cytidylate kinase